MKFKYAESKDWFYFIDDNSNKSASFTAKNKPGLYAEMKAWESAGNEIEPQFTVEELAAKEAEEKTAALESQNQTIITLLSKTQHIVDGDCDYSPEDIAACRAWRAKIKAIMRGGKIQDIPERKY